MIYTRKQEKIAKKIEEQSGISNWKDWKWQMKHAVTTLDQFEYLTGIHFGES